MMKKLIIASVAFGLLCTHATAFNAKDVEKLAKSNICFKCDLSGANLKGANLEGATK
jgi:uncharacterized protein YjbI with pentapeptide repeats